MYVCIYDIHGDAVDTVTFFASSLCEISHTLILAKILI